MENNKNDAFLDLNEEKTLFEWEAPARSFQKRNKDFWITAIAILILFSVVLYFIQEFFLIVALISVLFLYYALSTVPPENIKNKITNRYIYFGKNKYIWEDLESFYFKKVMSSDLIAIRTKLRIPQEIPMVINVEDKEKIKKIILKKIPLIEYTPNFVDKLTKWGAKMFPSEKREK